MRKRNQLLLLLCAILAMSMFSLTGCSKFFDNSGKSEGDSEVTERDYRITLFFANEEYIATGDESLEKFMVFESELTTMPGDAYLEAVEALKTVPEEGYSTLVTDQIKLNDVYVKENTAYVDFDSNGLTGGSLDETFLISQIVNTLINSFDEVTQVQFLVDGEIVESLMGHVDSAAPFTKDVFTE